MLLFLQLGDLADAEDALTEANILDNMDPEVWAYLCLVCLQTGRRLEAEQAYKYTVKVSKSTTQAGKTCGALLNSNILLH